MYEEFIPKVENKQQINVTIRKAIYSDFQAIAEIVSKRHKWPLEKCIENTKRQIGKVGEFAKLEIFVALFEKNLIGFGKINYFDPSDYSEKYLAPKGHYLSGIIIEKSMRRKGVGTLLTKARIEKINKIEREIFYFADSKNKASIEFHNKLGFEFITNNFSYPKTNFTPDNPPSLFSKKM